MNEKRLIVRAMIIVLLLMFMVSCEPQVVKKYNHSLKYGNYSCEDCNNTLPVKCRDYCLDKKAVYQCDEHFHVWNKKGNSELCQCYLTSCRFNETHNFEKDFLA